MMDGSFCHDRTLVHTPSKFDNAELRSHSPLPKGNWQDYDEDMGEDAILNTLEASQI